jgi:hypothetical protein
VREKVLFPALRVVGNAAFLTVMLPAVIALRLALPYLLRRAMRPTPTA